MFLGEYQHSLDAKGRVILPSRFRARLEGGCVLARGREPCVAVYPREEFEGLSRRLKEIPMGNRQARTAARVFFSGASEQIPDGQGRVLVPDNLRSFAGLQRELVIAGHGDNFEIWDRARWDAHMQEAQAEFTELTEPQTDLPF